MAGKAKKAKATPKPKAPKELPYSSNPFNKGVTYEAFLKNVTKTATVDKLLDAHKCTKEQKDWIKKELKLKEYNN